jgi:hypothetical protein
MSQQMKKLDLDKMDEDIEDHPRRNSYDNSSEHSIMTDEDDMDEDMIGCRGPRMSGVDEDMFEM